MKYKVTFPNTVEMSQISYIVRPTLSETKEEQAMWHYNRSRQHDNLPPLNNLPKGTKFVQLYELDVD